MTIGSLLLIFFLLVVSFCINRFFLVRVGHVLAKAFNVSKQMSIPKQEATLVVMTVESMYHMVFLTNLLKISTTVSIYVLVSCTVLVFVNASVEYAVALLFAPVASSAIVILNLLALSSKNKIFYACLLRPMDSKK